VQFFNFGNARELRRDLSFPKLRLYEHKGYKSVSHDLLDFTQAL
jgi:hypothetical protein